MGLNIRELVALILLDKFLSVDILRTGNNADSVCTFSRRGIRSFDPQPEFP